LRSYHAETKGLLSSLFLESGWKMAKYVKILNAGTLPEGGMQRVVVDDQPLVIVHQGGDYFALTDCCSHESFRLSEGHLTPGKIHCALHGAAFDLRSGAALSLPAYEEVAVWPVRVTGGVVEVAVED
jgi:3-phenylpropionate/trans-cinnamate dioxygenase ferredoxin component